MSCETGPAPEWPEVTSETRPWTRWWWHGSAVNPTDLTANMKQLNDAGFGGVEITPIYDVKGYENQTISFQSPEWMKVFEHTLKEGQRLNMGVDLANASGWPFGGPWIQSEDACKNVQFKHYKLKAGERMKEKIEFIQESYVRAVGHQVDISEVKFPVSGNTNLQKLALDQVRFKTNLPLQTLMAYNDAGEALDLTTLVGSNGVLDWTAPAGNWQLYAVFQGWHGKMVERAGTGGEGNVIDHFSEEATRKFLKAFDDEAKNIDLAGLRAFFNDSYEVDDAQGESNWTPLLFEEFRNLRGYDLKQYLPALFGNDSEEMNNRVLCDFRETISDLLLDRFTKVWADWTRTHGAIIRNQSHGSPANILDLYEASDIPETEGLEPMRIKMATSAGHVSGKPLIACEAATWLNEHFLATLSEVKQNFDRYLAHGVNHIVYHGTPYSPMAEEWPGWMFYAAVHFAPTNPWWNDLKAINEYVTNCQSFMQKSVPDNDILLYFPIYDAWSEKGRSMLPHFGGSAEKLTEELSGMLISKGYTFDYISDKQIQKLTAENKLIKSQGATYKTILVPKCENIPLPTMQKLLDLAKSGASIIFQEQLPTGVPGFSDLENRRQTYNELVRSIPFAIDRNISVSKRGNGQLLMGGQVEKMLTKLNILPEEIAGLGLWFNRVTRNEGTCYFISNWSDRKIDQWVTVRSSGKQAVWFDPMNKKMGKALIERRSNNQAKVYLQLAPGETLILQWYPYTVDLNDFPLWQISGEKVILNNEWTVSFVNGGPTIPALFKTAELKSWTEQSAELKKFSGTASYITSFGIPAVNAPAYQLNLGKVCESATVLLNGEKLGTVVGPEFHLVIDSSLLKKSNKLEVQVSNLMANRIIDMDKNGVNYKKFYNVNIAARKRENIGNDGVFTAAGWKPLESGLIGPVSLTPLQLKN
ncbi:MAG: hypothetical protein A2W90_09535 [Bacteroidetes bacterium GWF2_42_66]|nr:MAG: hypothetical protein A2W92_17445 [Bacteroidetes bacterium GWA2_42_15]OFX97601.1 MAG: hypothetical protein A2W89_01870 [Bacteroidetes bacterium GWE2_42_39]OFY43843.1 MAG: hypothetical protein A2W90_09535 [Bacteroidetes bacterium GWF2_42_66]